MYTGKANQGINSLLLWADRGSAIPRRAGSHVTVTREDKCHHSKQLPLPPFPPKFRK